MELQETATIEFFVYVKGNGSSSIWVTYKGKDMYLMDFIKMGSGDTDVRDVLKALQNKMRKMAFKGTMKQFIRRFFRLNSGKPDIFLRNGKIDMDGNMNGYIQYDDDEIEYGLQNPSLVYESIKKGLEEAIDETLKMRMRALMGEIPFEAPIDIASFLAALIEENLDEFTADGRVQFKTTMIEKMKTMRV
jgi:hypothetical protein